MREASAQHARRQLRRRTRRMACRRARWQLRRRTRRTACRRPPRQPGQPCRRPPRQAGSLGSLRAWGPAGDHRAGGWAGGPTARQTDRHLLRQPVGRADGRTARAAVGRQRCVLTGAARGDAPERVGPVLEERRWQAPVPWVQGAAPRDDTDVRSRRNAPGQRHGQRYGRRRPQCQQRRRIQQYLRLRRLSMGRRRDEAEGREDRQNNHWGTAQTAASVVRYSLT